MDVNSKQALDQHPGLEGMSLRMVALRETVVPPGTFDFFQPPLSVKVKSCSGALVAAWWVGAEEGSIYLGVVTLPWLMRKYTSGTQRKEQQS